MDSLKRQGRPDFETLLICGGLSKNQIFIQTHAEACSLPVLCPNEKEMVLVGAAILGACAAKFYPDLEVCFKFKISFLSKKILYFRVHPMPWEVEVRYIVQIQKAKRIMKKSTKYF